jgi:hypothetical protein
MPDLWKWPFLRCFSETAAAFREQIIADYASGDLFRRSTALERLREMNERNRRTSLLYRLIDRRWLVPLTGLLDLCRDASDDIEQHGLLGGMRRALERFGIHVTTRVSDEARRLFESDQPILFTGNHPCLWGPDLWSVAAALDQLCPKRRDFMFLTWTLVPALCPGVGPYSAPVVVTSRRFERFTHDERAIADDRPLGSEELFRGWTPDLPSAYTRRENHQALANMARQWLEGRHVLIFPTGGAGTKALWFAGIGRVARLAGAQLDSRAPDPHILFFRLKGAHDFMLLRPPFLSRWHPARALSIFYPTRVEVEFGEAFRLRDWRDRFLAMTDRQVARFLQGRFTGKLPQKQDPLKRPK